MRIRPVRMLMVGAGLMGKVHLEAAGRLDSVKYVGVVDVNDSLARELGAKRGLKWFNDPAAAIKATRPDAVDLCVPTHLHRPLIELCAGHKLHVLCEKPITLTKLDARAVEKTAVKAGIRIMVAQVLRFWPEYVFTVAAARRRLFGKIRSVECQRLSPPPGWNSWMMKPEFGGGAVIDLQIHDMDFVRQLLGKPHSIQSLGRKISGAFNAVHSRLFYPENIPVVIDASYVMPSSYPFRMYYRIEFEEAVLEMDFWRLHGERLKVFPVRGKACFPKLLKADPYQAEIDYFGCQLISSRRFNRVPLEESIEALELCTASERSCRNRTLVKLDKS